MEYTQGFKHRKWICPTFYVTDPIKRLPMSARDCYQAIGWDPSNYLTKRLDINQAIAFLFKRLLPCQAIASSSSDWFGAVCYYDVAVMLYDVVMYSMMSQYIYPILFQMYSCPYDEIMSNDYIGTPNLIKRCIKDDRRWAEIRITLLRSNRMFENNWFSH